MKKLLLALPMLLLTALTVSAQTTATNFTASDCSSNSHTLYTDLDNGKIVVLVWVMPCGNCIGGAKAAWDAAQSFAVSNPGKVVYYLSDDVGNASCSTLSSWASTNSIGPANLTVFDNSGTAINETNYGGSGMPHVMVIGGLDHKIYFNEKNGAASGITTAINSAIAATGVKETTAATSELKVFPNPAKERVSVNYSLGQSSAVSIIITNVVGAKVKTLSYPSQAAGQHEINITLDNSLSNGTYFLQLNAGGMQQTVKFAIVK